MCFTSASIFSYREIISLAAKYQQVEIGRRSVVDQNRVYADNDAITGPLCVRVTQFHVNVKQKEMADRPIRPPSRSFFWHISYAAFFWCF